jgi:hypothetical protein
MRVEFATAVSWVQAYKRLVDVSADLNVGGSFDKLDACKSTGRNLTSTVGRLGTIGYNLGFHVSNQVIRIRATPYAKVID